MPGAIESKLAEVLVEARNLRIALEKEVEERRRDHDKIIVLEQWCKTLFKRVEELEEQGKADEREMQVLRGLGTRVAEIETWRKQVEHEEKKKFESQISENKADKKEESKDRKSKVWDILMEIFKIAIAAGLGAALGKHL